MRRETYRRSRETFSCKTTCLRGMLICKRMKSITLRKSLKNLQLKMNNTMQTYAKSKRRWRSLLGSNMNKTIK